MNRRKYAPTVLGLESRLAMDGSQPVGHPTDLSPPTLQQVLEVEAIVQMLIDSGWDGSSAIHMDQMPVFAIPAGSMMTPTTDAPPIPGYPPIDQKDIQKVLEAIDSGDWNGGGVEGGWVPKWPVMPQPPNGWKLTGGGNLGQIGTAVGIVAKHIDSVNNDKDWNGGGVEGSW